MRRSAFLLIVFLVPVTFASAQIRKAQRALDDGNVQEALNIVHERLEEKPDDYRAYRQLAAIHKAQAATAEGDEYLDHVAAMVDALRTVIELRPRDADAVTRELLLEYQTEFLKAIEQYNSAAAAPDAEAESIYYGMAALFFRSAAAIMPDSLDPYLNWAIISMQGENQEDAIYPLQQAIMVAPDDSSAHEWYDYLARIYASSGRSDEAVALMEEAVDKFPDIPEMESLLLQIYSTTGREEEAIEKYRVRAEQMPDDRVTQYNLGSLLLQAEEYDEAIVYLKRAVEIDETDVDALYNLGASYINKATEVQKESVALADTLREMRAGLSDEEIEAQEALVIALDEERAQLMAMAIPFLESAKVYGEQKEGSNVTSICIALYQAYAQTNQMEMVAQVEACAGL